MAARSKYAEPADTPGMTAPPLDPAAAYAAALDAQEAARRTPDGDEPVRSKVDSGDGSGDWYDSIEPSPLAASTAVADAARRALNDCAGHNAVAREEAAFKLRVIDRQLTAAESTGLGLHIGAEFAALLARQRATATLVDNLTAAAQRDRERADAREALEATHAALTGRLNEGLTEARANLAEAAHTAQNALAALHAEAERYRGATRDARAELVAAGFDASLRFDGAAYPTHLGAELVIDGRVWPVTEPVAIVARLMFRVASACGQRGRILAGALMRQSGGSALHADALLRTVPAPAIDSRPVAGPSMPALKDWAKLQPPGVANKSAYQGPDKPRPRRLGILGR